MQFPDSGADTSSFSSFQGSSEFGLRNWNPWQVMNTSPKAESVCTTSSRFSASSVCSERRAGSLYDEMIALHASNHNRADGRKGIRDVQQHKSGGKNTTIVTNITNNRSNAKEFSNVNFQVFLDSDSTAISKTGAENETPGTCFSPDLDSKNNDFPLVFNSEGVRNKNKRTNAGQTESPIGFQVTQENKLTNYKKIDHRDNMASGTHSKQVVMERVTIGSAAQNIKNINVDDERILKSYNNLDSQTPPVINVISSNTSQNDENNDSVDESEGNEEGVAVVTDEEADAEGEGEGEGVDDSTEEDDETECQELSDLDMVVEVDKKDKKERKPLNIAHLDKEGYLIGLMNIFADVVKREFIIPLNDDIAVAFLVEPGRFRAVATRTKCEIELSRRILCRRMGCYRWVKYLILQIRGPSIAAVNQCDMMMIKQFPLYKLRKEYKRQASVTLYVKETIPDNTDLYFSFQRTGPSMHQAGELHLTPPYALSATRPLETMPWKLCSSKLHDGCIEPRNVTAENALQHIYPEWGMEKIDNVGFNYRWEKAADFAVEMEKKRDIERKMRVKTRQLNAEPLYLI